VLEETYKIRKAQPWKAHTNSIILSTLLITDAVRYKDGIFQLDVSGAARMRSIF
jgi:hypothetical protein